MSKKRNRMRTGSSENAGRGNNLMMKVISTLLIMYIITGAALLILAMLLYKMQLSENIVTIGIMVIYVLAGLLGGLIVGKRIGSRRFLWGMLLGAVYFLILFVGSLILNRGIDTDLIHAATTLIMCVGAGMIGGMLS